jgi:hypothetical protein
LSLGYKRFPGNPFLPASATPLIYNIHLGKWTTTYTRGSNPPAPVTTGKPNQSPTGEGGSNNTEGGGGNGAAIGGAVAGVVAVVAIIAFFVARRRRQRATHQPVDTKDPETTAHDPVLPSTGNKHYEPGNKDEYHQTQSAQYTRNQEPHNSQSPQDITQFHQGSHNSTQYYHDPHNSAQYSSMSDQHNYPTSPQSSSYYPPPLSPPPPSIYSPSISKDTQDNIRQLEHQIALGEKQLAAGTLHNKSSNNPQYNPGPSEIQHTPSIRGPQGAGIPVSAEPIPSADHRELARKIEIMHAELQNLQSQLKL